MTEDASIGDPSVPQQGDDEDEGEQFNDDVPYKDQRSHSSQSHGDRHIHVSGGNQGGIHQYNANLPLPESVARKVFRPVTAPQPLTEAYQEDLGKRFIAPGRYEEAKRTLESGDTVIITGQPGSGRRSTALRLLAETASSSHELLNDADEDETLWDAESVAPGEGRLLDLSSYSPETAESALARWKLFRAQVAEQHCRLVLVLSPEIEHLLDVDLLQRMKRIERPDGRAVFAQHLQVEAVEHTSADLSSPSLLPRMSTDRLSELARLALLVREAKAINPNEGFATWLEQALEAFSNRAEQVTTWLGKHPEGHKRALILTAAMLQGASTDAVFEATKELIKTVKYPEDEKHVLSQTGITQRLAKLDICVDTHHRVHFDSLNFDQEVRTHFWAEHPDLRKKLREWVGRAAPRGELDEQSRNAFVVRFAEQCLATGRYYDLPSLAEQWVKRGRNGKSRGMLGCVELLLETGLLDERFGGLFRKKIYDWSIRPKKTDLPRDLDEVLIRICSRVIKPSHPDQALVRLHHLARRDDETVSQQAGDQIIELAEDPFFFRRALNRLTDELVRKEDTQDVHLFLHLVHPRKLVADENRSQALVFDRGVRRQLVTGWRAVQARPVSIWEGQIRSWLQAAADAPRHTALLGVLVDACDRRIAALSHLHGLALRWVRASHGETRHRRSHTAAELLNLIDASQDLDFLTNTGEPAR